MAPVLVPVPRWRLAILTTYDNTVYVQTLTKLRTSLSRVPYDIPRIIRRQIEVSRRDTNVFATPKL